MTGRDALNRLDASISGMAYAERLEIGALTKCLTDNPSRPRVKSG
jgi:hypothetical protein